MNEEKVERIHIFVSGVVQGVGFRCSASSTANSLGLGGWVRNLEDGRVEMLAEGGVKAIEALLKWCERGPSRAKVDTISIQARQTIPHPSLPPFEIK
jgi:acylphosphatase